MVMFLTSSADLFRLLSSSLDVRSGEVFGKNRRPRIPVWDPRPGGCRWLLVSTGRWSPGGVPGEVGRGRPQPRLDGIRGAGNVRQPLAHDTGRGDATGIGHRRDRTEGAAGHGHAEAG